MRGVLIIAFTCMGFSLCAQISGQVKGFKSGLFLKGAEVFIDNSLNKVVTDDKGYFTIEGLLPGTYRIGCALPGYETTYQTVRLEKSEKYLLFILKKDRGKTLSDKPLIAEIFSTMISQNKIVPAWNDRCQVKSSKFKYADEPAGRRIFGQFELENSALGYRIKCHVLNYNQIEPLYLLQFYLLKGSEEEQQIWEQNRFTAYQFGVNHFLESILQNTYYLNGFKLHDESGNPVSPENFLTIGLSGEINRLNLNGRIKVTLGTSEEGYESWIEAHGPVRFSDIGQVLNPDSVKTGGAFNEKSLSFRLPFEYTPSVDKKIFRLEPYFEKPYLHLDKPYYFPGDTIWFKAYMNYNQLYLIESLSTVLHIELIEQQEGGQILYEKKLKIEDGEAWGEFVIPQTYTANYVAIRAYTNWQRNYGDDQFFIKYLPVIPRTSNLIGERRPLLTNDLVELTFDKQNYKPRDRISFSIRVTNETGQQVSAWMSVAVTDYSMVRLLNDSITITRCHPIKPLPETRRIAFPLERGLTLSGQFFNEAGKPAMVSLTMMSEKFAGQAYNFTTDLYGKFSIAGLAFYDSIPIRYSAKLDKKLLYTGKLVIDERKPAPLNLSWPAPMTNLERADIKIDKNTVVLNEVIIEAKRIAQEKKKDKPAYLRPFGEPDHILEGTSLNYAAPNVIEMMRGRIPGIHISFDGSNYIIRSTRSGSFTLGLSPLILVDDQPVSGTQALLGVNPVDVVAIEVTTRLNALYGSAGANGVIAVYTKAGGLRGRFEEYESVKTIKVNGFATPAKFYGVNHTAYFIPPNSDFRTTLGWFPLVISSTRSGADLVTFYASDSTGPYLVTVEGVTAEGKPFRAEQLIELETD